MTKTITEGCTITTVKDLQVDSATDPPIVPAGTTGTVRRIYTDALGGYQVEFPFKNNTILAVAYANQLIPRPKKATATEGKAQTSANGQSVPLPEPCSAESVNSLPDTTRRAEKQHGGPSQS